MHIHFVCTGNSFRSRLAEAYCRSLVNDTSITVSSSGIRANQTRLLNGPICWYAMRILRRHHLVSFMSWQEQQTTVTLLQNVDVLICMNEEQATYCKSLLGIIHPKLEVWSIPDLNEMDGFIPTPENPTIEIDINHIQLTEKIYAMIIKKVDVLMQEVGDPGFPSASSG